MKFKLIVVLAEDALTDRAIETARCNRVHRDHQCAWQRPAPGTHFHGAEYRGQRNMILFLVEEHRARQILEAIGVVCGFDVKPGSGVAFQIDIEDTIGLRGQIDNIEEEISKEEL